MCLSFSMMLFFLIMFISPTCSKNNDTPLSSKLQAENLIRGLNLFPKHSINIAKNDSHFVHGNIVEKKFTFPSFVDSSPSVEELGHHAGYYSLPHSKAARMFYFFFEFRNNKDDPVVIWLTGGPGCSSELALFYENGPFQFSKDNNNLSLVWNEYGWDAASNIIFVDQPIGTGFSYTTDDSDIRHDENKISNDLYDAFASRVHQGNKAKEGIHINLKGFAIGNGLTNPEIQYKAYTDYALDNGLINKEQHDNITELFPQCQKGIQDCGTEGGDACLTARQNCEKIFDQIMDIAGHINYYDIRKKSGDLSYDFTKMETFLNLKIVREALGNSRWVDAVQWSGQKEFTASPSTPYLVDSEEAGTLKSHGPLAFLKVKEAGHMVPMDQPKAALHMLKDWMQGQLVRT
ncbi:serine carboxypeptidase [Trifolium repens]|nr:serine carboxypeptidase [Trifolium repens]